MDLSGRVTTSGGKRVPRLTVKLIAPRRDRQPELVTVTSDEGEFVFKGIEKKQYLLQAYQGVVLVYRDVLDTKTTTRKEIELTVRRSARGYSERTHAAEPGTVLIST